MCLKYMYIADAGARNRLDAVLQGLVERSDSERLVH